MGKKTAKIQTTLNEHSWPIRSGGGKDVFSWQRVNLVSSQGCLLERVGQADECFGSLATSCANLSVVLVGDSLHEKCVSNY